MSNQSNQLSFELLLEGTRDRKTLTVRRVRSILMEELNLPMEEAQTLLETTPVSVFRSNNIDLVRPLLERLSRSGARAQIIRHTETKTPERKKATEKPKESLKVKIPREPLKLSEIQSLKRSQAHHPQKTHTSPQRSLAPTPRASLSTMSASGKSAFQNKPPRGKYRSNVMYLDQQFRGYLRREFAISPTLLTLLALLSCALFIQVGIYVDTVQYRRYQKSVRLLEDYIAIAVLGGNEGYLDPSLAKQLRR